MAVVGAGIVGCVMARAIRLAGARVAVLEKATHVPDGASKDNSAILHTGFDAPEMAAGAERSRLMRPAAVPSDRGKGRMPA